MSLQAFEYDESLGVYSHGMNKVSAKTSFRDMGLSSGLLTVVLNNLKYDVPSAVQKTALPAILAGRNVLAASETGSGKTVRIGRPFPQKD